MKKREGELKAAAIKELHRQLPTFYVFQIATAGWPDRGIVGCERTTFWEMKHATPDFESPGNQELFCMRLAAHAYCRYVIWWEGRTGIGQKTMIIHPQNIHNHSLLPEAVITGFNHQWLVNYIRRIHRA